MLFQLVPEGFSDLKNRTIMIEIGKSYWDLEICRNVRKNICFQGILCTLYHLGNNDFGKLPFVQWCQMVVPSQ